MKYVQNYHFKGFLLSLFVLCNTIGCGCKRVAEETGQELTMSISKSGLSGSDKKAELVFSLANGRLLADLENYTLGIDVDKGGDAAHHINYTDKNGVEHNKTEGQHELVHLSEVPYLTPNKNSFRLPVTLNPQADAQKMQVKFHLIKNNGAGQESNTPLHTVSVVWEDEKQSANFVLTALTPTVISGAIKTVQIQVENKNTTPSTDGQLKLKVTRTIGSAATIKGSTEIDKTQVYTLDLPGINGSSTVDKTLTLCPCGDTQVVLSLQLQKDGQDIGAPIPISWKLGASSLQVQDISYDATTGKVRCNLRNTGTSELTDIQLNWKTSLDETAILQDNIPKLEAGQTLRNCELGMLEFGDNKNVTITCTFSWKEDGDAKNGGPIVRTVSKDTNAITLNVQHDPKTGSLHIVVENKGSVTAEGVRLHYENIDNHDQAATLADQTTAVITLKSLNKDQKVERTLPLVFKGGEQATFRFKVTCTNEGDVVDLIEQEETFSVRPVNLSLVVLSPDQNKHSGKRMLYGPQDEIKLRIRHDGNDQPLQLENLKLMIINESKGGGAILAQKGGDPISEITGDHLGNLDEDLKLYLKPDQDQKEAKFKFQLTYQGKLVDAPVVVQWKEYILYINGTDQLVGNEAAKFSLFSSTGYLDLSHLTVSIQSDDDDKATFELIDTTGRPVSNNQRLDKIMKPNLGLKKEGVAIDGQFRIKKWPVKEKTATATIIIKRGTSTLATKEVVWKEKARGKTLTLDLQRFNIDDTESVKVTLLNTSLNKQAIDLRKLRLRVTPTVPEVVVEIGNISSSNIYSKLNQVLGVEKLGPQVETNVNLSLAQLLGKIPATGITLEIVDEKDVILQKQYLICVNSKVGAREVEILGFLGDKPIKTLMQQADYVAVHDCLNKLRRVKKEYGILVEALHRIKEQHLDFGPVIVPVIDTYKKKVDLVTKKIKECEEVAAGLKDEKALAKWADDLRKIITATNKGMEEGADKVSALEGMKISEFLAAPDNNREDLHGQSIRALYNRFKQHQKTLMEFCQHAGSNTPRGDLPELLRTMEIELPGIKKQAQAIFEAGFAKLSQDVENQQVQIGGLAKGKDLDGRLLICQGCNTLLSQCGQLSIKSGEEVGIDPVQLADFLAKQYFVLADHLNRLRKSSKRGKNAGTENECLKSLLAIRNAMGEIVKNNKTAITIQAYENILKYTEFAAQTSKKSSKNSSLLVNGRQASVTQLPTVLERLKHDDRQNSLKEMGNKANKELKEAKGDLRSMTPEKRRKK